MVSPEPCDVRAERMRLVRAHRYVAGSSSWSESKRESSSGRQMRSTTRVAAVAAQPALQRHVLERGVVLAQLALGDEPRQARAPQRRERREAGEVAQAVEGVHLAVGEEADADRARSSGARRSPSSSASASIRSSEGTITW